MEARMKKIPKAWIETEAMSMARSLIRNKLRAEGLKLSMVEAKQVTKAAKALLKHNPDIYKSAKSHLLIQWSDTNEVSP
jgi:hypothetical protein